MFSLQSCEVRLELLQGVTLDDLPQKNDLRKQLQNDPRTSRRRSGPLSTRRNALVSTRDPVVGPNGLKRTSENPENPPYKAPYQNFQLKIGHSAAPGLPEGFYIRVGRRHCADVHEHVFAGHRPRHRVRGSVHTEPCAGPGAGRVHTAP